MPYTIYINIFPAFCLYDLQTSQKLLDGFFYFILFILAAKLPNYTIKNVKTCHAVS